MPSDEVSARRHPASELQEVLLTTDSVEGFLGELARVAARATGASVGVTVLRDGRPVTIASSDALAERLDEVGYEHEHGPCLTALRRQETVVVEDTQAADVPASYARAALAAGVRSVLATPFAAETSQGALNVYASQPRAFGPAEKATLERFAEETSRTLALALRIAQHAQLSEQLQAALTSRTVIDQAIGILMAQNRCPADEAFAILRQTSQNRNVKLRRLAAEIVERVGGVPPRVDPT